MPVLAMDIVGVPGHLRRILQGGERPAVIVIAARLANLGGGQSGSY